MIADSRFVKNIKKEIERLNEEVLKTCKDNNFKVSHLNEFEYIDFKDTEKTKQYRATYWIEKERHFTYNNVYSAINKIKPTRYDIIRPKIVRL